MLVDISFNPKAQSALLEFQVEHFDSDLRLKECLAIMTVISADFYLDPEIEPEHLAEYIAIAREQNKNAMLFEISEDGVELELK
ncbi:MAG: hypothetical protein CME62_04885 [Halobacteriovoraceae bacterium]|nr:hypothetical protein [Halobacteriovoraceae bacterium]|tara:strand:- start:161 stop:412 length:252 start_codon:yes stop_codon:yes gene_type:complete